MSRLNEIFFKQTVLSIVDIEAQYVLQQEPPVAFSDLLFFCLARNKAVMREDLDKFSVLKKTSIKTIISSLQRKGQIRIRYVSLSGNGKKRKIKIVVLTDKGWDKVFEVIKKHIPGLLSSQYKAAVLYKMDRIRITPEALYLNREVRDVIRGKGFGKGKITPRRVHDICAGMTYWSLLANTELRYIDTFSSESVYNGSGKLVDEGEKVRPEDRSKACRSDLYYSLLPYGSGAYGAEYMIEHDMCAEHIPVLSQKIKQYHEKVYIPRIKEHCPLPLLVFTITGTLGRFNALKSERDSFRATQSALSYTESLIVIRRMISKGALGLKETRDMDSAILTVKFMRFILNGYAEDNNGLMDFLDRCCEVYGEDTPVDDVIREVCERADIGGSAISGTAISGSAKIIGIREGYEKRTKGKGVTEVPVMARKRSIYSVVLSNEPFCRQVLSKGAAVMCMSASYSQDMVTARPDDRNFEMFFIEVMKQRYADFRILSYEEVHRIDLSGVKDTELSEISLRNAFRCKINDNDRIFCCENVSSDIGALWRLRFLLENDLLSGPLFGSGIGLVLLYSQEELATLPEIYKKVFVDLLEKAAGRIEILVCRFEHIGAKVRYASLFENMDVFIGALSSPT